MIAPDLRAFLVVLAITGVIASGAAFWSARWVSPKPTGGSTSPRVLTLLGGAMAAVGVVFAWVATNSTLFALTTLATGVVVVVGVLALGAAVATAVRRPDWMGRRAVAFVVGGGLLLVLNAALLATQVPFLFRFQRSLDTVSLQAQQTWEDPPPALRTDGATPADASDILDELGDFPINQISVTDCGPDFPREGLSFWLGDSTTTFLVWCQLGHPTTDASVSVKHLDGAWFLVRED